MKILEQTKIGDMNVRNRMVMAPMTRSRADENGLINDLTVLYYAQRASAGLIISETINISEQAIGMPNTPGLFTKEQVDSWKKVTQAVHNSGGKIVAQLNHSGRASHSLNRNGQRIVGPSAIAIKSQKIYTKEGQKQYETPEALAFDEIKAIIKDYKIAATHGMEAGFDGVELHSAMGYLPNQFLSESSNQRTDEYGGTIERRSKFVIEVVQEMINAVGKNKVGVRLSPSILIHDIFDSSPVDVYNYLIKQLDKLPIAYFHLIQPLFPLADNTLYPKDVLTTFGSLITKDIIVNGGYDRESAEKEIQEGRTQFVSFGALFLANPDLPDRFAINADLNSPDKATMYAGGDEKGYTDYPYLADSGRL